MIEQKVEAYIERWGGGISRGGNETANLQMFLTELCTLLDLPQPDPARADRNVNAYTFERSITEQFFDGGKTARRIDLYRRGCFVLEGKDTGKKVESDGWDAAITKALKQAEVYARALPVEEGRPPFIVVVDVGISFSLFSEFSRSGGNYVAFPDQRNHKIALEQLRNPDTRELLRTVWLEPLGLDPTRYAGKITRVIADQLAKLAKSLEESGHPAEQVASFLMRCLFTMFSEDVGLLPERSFTDLLTNLKAKPESFCRQLRSLWQTMNTGGFAPALDADVLRFNGGLFADAQVIELNAEQVGLLAAASKADWRYVEPAIFGTLLERALNPRERHKLGAHYTPRAYVERLVLPTIIEPLRAEWADVQAAALTYKQQRKTKEAVTEIRKFHHQLCQTRVLDPACGSGNFLYVTLEHMKRLEAEVLEVLGSIVKSGSFELEGLTVDPHQFLGLEINPRAAKIAEMVLWIGYLQWHFRTYGKVNPPEPVLRDFHNIEHRDALITYDAVELVTDESGKPVTRWDGVTTKTSPITGEQVPDEAAQVQQCIYRNPKKAEWPKANYIVGNPPYIGARRIRLALGDDYLTALRSAYSDIPEHADFVMYWWAKASDAVGSGVTEKFGLITTNSLRQTFSRKVVDASFERNPGLGISFVVPDHPWVDSTDGAAVRVTLTTVGSNTDEGRIARVVCEQALGDDEIAVDLAFETGHITPNLTIGVDPAKANELRANHGIACVGFQLTGQGFIVDSVQARLLDNGKEGHGIIRPLLTGRDLNQSPRGLYAIDLFGLSVDEVRAEYPMIYQWLLERVKPERDQNKDHSSREFWWLFARTRADFRPALADPSFVVATSLTAKHRVFTRVAASTVCDSTTVIFAVDDFFNFGVLSSRIHIAWALAAGGRLGVGNDSRYNKTRCFETFPFPDATPTQQATIRELAERLDTQRKRQQAQHPELTLTGMYNVLEKLRGGEALTAKEQLINSKGLVSMLRELHDDLDHAVFAAYGWDDLAAQLVGLPGATTPLPDKSDAQAEAEEAVLLRLVELNSQRAAEEARGQIRWLRPEYQNPSAAAPQQAEAELEASAEASSEPVAKVKKITWPKGMREQIAAVRNTLGNQAMSLESLVSHFAAPKTTTPLIVEALAALEELGMLYQEEGHYRIAS